MNQKSKGDAFIGLDIRITHQEDDDNHGNNDGQENNNNSTRQSTGNAPNDAQPPATAATATAATNKSRKRPRQPSSPAPPPSSTRAPKKPRPPPAPPSSLVKLLQKDASVLSYFQSLQENLEYDVEKWKSEATKWKQQLAAVSTTAAAAGAPSKATAKSSNGRDDTPNKTKQQYSKKKTAAMKKSLARLNEKNKNNNIDDNIINNNNNKEGKSAIIEIPITDELLFNVGGSSSSSSDEDSNDEHASNSKKKRIQQNSLPSSDNDNDDDDAAANDDDDDDDDYSTSFLFAETTHTTTKNNNNNMQQNNTTTVQYQTNENAEESKRYSHIIRKLKEAKQCLDRLGVSLVEVEVISTTRPYHHAPLAEEEDEEKEDDDVIICEDNRKQESIKIVGNAIGGGGGVQPPNSFLNNDNDSVTNNAADNNNTSTTMEDKGQTNHLTTTTTIERILHRQPDEKIAAEMMASLRTLIKASSLIGSSTSDAVVGSKGNKGKGNNDDEDDDDVSATEGVEDQALSHDERVHNARLRRQYHPFCRDGKLHIPTVYCYPGNTMGNTTSTNASTGSESTSFELNQTKMPLHPASLGLQNLMRVLSIMDTYCRDDLDDDAWDAIFEHWNDGNNNNNNSTYGDDENLQKEEEEEEDILLLKVGMRNRCRLADRILSSLDVEITRIWALSDRTSNLATPSIHFHPADVIDNAEDGKTRGDNDTIENDNDNDHVIGSYGAKSYNRLLNLEERLAHARIATLMHRHRGDWQKALELVVGFIVSSAPSLGVEQYPKMPPVLSLCILEALLASENYVPADAETVDGPKKCVKESEQCANIPEGLLHRQIIQLLFNEQPPLTGADSHEKSALLLLKALAYPVHVAASIWRERSYCCDDRIRDIALIELAAYHRLLSTADGSWLNTLQFENANEENISKVGIEILSSAVSNVLDRGGSASSITAYTTPSRQAFLVSGMSCLLSLLTIGDVDQVIKVCDKILFAMKALGTSDSCDKDCSTRSLNSCLFLFPACCYAYANIMCRKWDSMKLGNMMGRHTASAFTVQDRFLPLLDSVTELVDPYDWAKIDAITQCCVVLGDGRSLLRLANNFLPNATKATLARRSKTSSAIERSLISRVISVFVDAGEIPTVRVINLKRRPDRLIDFMSNANKEQVLVIKGPAKLKRKYLVSGRKKATTKEAISLDKNEACSGDFAFDGQGNLDKLKDQMLERLEGNVNLSELVTSTWRPGDLRAFDNQARSGSEPVHTSNTEIACSLSHIASWMGVVQSLSEMDPNTGSPDAVYTQKLIRMFKISGFARGPALLHENADMDPVPVCVILEDDAVLSDRFAERLACLLEELPRDFHFCSLGYSRPKTAPMIEFSSQLGIPSCIWYLTGYIVSLEGARHLIKSLPVSGPVDSWIGLKMCSNWDNVFGQWIGVGKHARAHSKLPSRKDLAKILKFRGFAASVPLCAQKVGSTDTTTRVSWRDRDTDITYSGKA